ncbi:MAG: glycosyltransferase family 87 protein [Candidatus Shapirobacteria bacterium]|nr:glycosyltransferase family 87 protein [Candidatus Shapirobacteria bacterium]MDD4410554.1 glycosyltransferase family 87 protein [Candidatus Shapirobacteria bacterium]
MLSKYKKILFLAILIRVLIMPFFYHPDIKSQHYHFQFLSRGIFNIYEYLSQNKSTLGYKDTFNYLPLTYYTFGITQAITKPFLGNDFYLWLNDWGENKNNYINIIYYMFLLKIPYLILDIGLAILLLKIFNNSKIFYFWLFNPISIYLIYVLGNFDILPTFLTVLSFYFLRKQKLLFSYLSIGLAIALKMYPIIFVAFIFFYEPKNILKHLKYCCFSLIPLIITVIPFINQNTFISSFLGSGLTQKILEYKLLNLPIFPILYLLILINYIFSKSKYKFELAVTQTFLIFIGLVKFHPQWLIWFFPFILIIFINSKIFNKLYLILFFILIYIYIFLFNDNFLFWGHLIPIDSAFIDITSPFQLIKLKTSINPSLLQQQIHQILLLLGIIGSFFYAKKK